jgi:hypothetical protein
VTGERQWTYDELVALAIELNELHQSALAEVGRIARDQGLDPLAV